MEEKLSIRVKILDREYKILINRPDEERIRRAIDIINNRAADYRNIFSSYDAQDHLSMVSIHLADKLLQAQEENSNTEKAIEQLTNNLNTFNKK